MSDKVIMLPFIEKVFPIITGDIQGRGYILKKDPRVFGGMVGAELYMRNVMKNDKYMEYADNRNHVIMFAYGNEKRGRVVEAWLYDVSGDWPGVAIPETWVFEKGEEESIYQLSGEPEPRVKTILDLEEAFRQETGDLEEYISNCPDNIEHLRT